MTPLRITDNCLPNSLARLAEIAALERHGMLDRLISDFHEGSNRFSRPGEGLWVMHEGEDAIAVGGVNIDPYYDDSSLGRIRHLYVHPERRCCGVGTGLMMLIEGGGAAYFESYQLFTANPVAAKFYEALGYARVEGRYKVSHAKRVLV